MIATAAAAVAAAAALLIPSVLRDYTAAVTTIVITCTDDDNDGDDGDDDDDDGDDDDNDDDSYNKQTLSSIESVGHVWAAWRGVAWRGVRFKTGKRLALPFIDFLCLVFGEQTAFKNAAFRRRGNTGRPSGGL